MRGFERAKGRSSLVVRIVKSVMFAAGIAVLTLGALDAGVASAAPPEQVEGAVSCDMSPGVIKFGPRLVDGSPTTSRMKFRAHLDCSDAAGSQLGITGGKLVGRATIPTDCRLIRGTSFDYNLSNVTMTIRWTGSRRYVPTTMSFNPAHLNVRFAGFGFGIDEHTTVTGSFAQSVGDGFGGRVDVVLPGVPLANNLAAVEAACVPKTRGNAGGGGVKTLVFDQDPFFWLGFPF